MQAIVVNQFGDADVLQVDLTAVGAVTNMPGVSHPGRPAWLLLQTEFRPQASHHETCLP
jgi:hypothetical protein